MNTLFDIPETPSPRLVWMEIHKITCEQMPDGNGDSCYVASAGWAETATGDTPEDACIALALRLGISDWRGGLQ
jgi:hypothetical protein